MKKPVLMLGNEAVAQGLAENGCRMATAYPGTPSSEILASVAAVSKRNDLDMHVQWATNEKVAFEIAYAGAISGLRTAVAMKQVGLNVAADPLMSAAYMGVRGGFVVISADDPGPHSSQTEQDSRLMAMMAKIPVLDPCSPVQARDLVALAYDLSEAHEVPVMLRPTTRICHARQDIVPGTVVRATGGADFQKDPTRWAATPKFRFHLHTRLEEKLAAIADFDKTAPRQVNPQAQGRRAVVASGVAAAHAQEIIQALGLWQRLPLFQVIQPFPLHTSFMADLSDRFDQILVLEETMPVMEMQMADSARVLGKRDGTVSRVGELGPEDVERILCNFARVPYTAVETAQVPGRRPTLCAGCPHRASFFAIKKAAPRGIYTSDIGCYTLGMNLGAVDTVLCMGAAISQAAGFYHAHRGEKKPPDIVATIGDSTFFHAGMPALVDAVTQGVRFVLVILDNRTTAMTGNQPTPASGISATGEALHPVNLEGLVTGCGVDWLKTADPIDLPAFVQVLKEAVAWSRENGPAVVIARHPCLLDRRQKDAGPGIRVRISDGCDGCGFCVDHFECPALVMASDGGRVILDEALCSGCGVCIHVCPKKSIEAVEAQTGEGQ